MKLSIITINYNNKKGLQETIDSVISQTFKDFEWIIIDGGSTDGSKELIENNQSHVTHWCSESDNGVYNAMNKGIKKATGDYCLFLNSGDRLHDENVIGKIVKEFGDTDFITGVEWWVDNSYKYIKTMIPPYVIGKYYMMTSSLSHQCTFIKTDLLKKRPYDESLVITADWEEMFYEIVMNNKTHKTVNIIITDFLIGGISHRYHDVNSQERKIILNKYLSHREQDLISIVYLSEENDKKSLRKMADVAYTAFANNIYSQQEYLDVFLPYKKQILRGCVMHQKIIVWMCLSGYMRIAIYFYSFVKRFL